MHERIHQGIDRPITDDLRVSTIRELAPPLHLLRQYPASTEVTATVEAGRRAVHEILHDRDDRLVVVVGPCSIHDASAAREYAHRLADVRERLRADLEIVMRVYFEKPRSTVGWKGLINDPHLDGSFDINTGLRIARSLLVDINAMGVPAGMEFLDPISPQYVADLVAWGAIGARTTESQVHRELASGLSCPVGFKNGTDGNLKIAVDAILAARHPHCFLGVTKAGVSAIVQTRGNDDGHVILRGGSQPNHDEAHVRSAIDVLSSAGLKPKLMIDCSHANSLKQHQRQMLVARDVAHQLAQGQSSIMGVMVESNLVEGNQKLVPGGLSKLAYGVSVTDACLGWRDTDQALETLAEGVRERRAMHRSAGIAASCIAEQP